MATGFEVDAQWISFREFKKSMGKSGYPAAVRNSKDRTDFAVLLEDSTAMLCVIIAFAGVALATDCTRLTSTVSHPSQLGSFWR